MTRTPVYGLPVRSSFICPTQKNEPLIQRVLLARQWDPATVAASVRLA